MPLKPWTILGLDHLFIAMNRLFFLLVVAFATMGVMPASANQQAYDTLQAAGMFTIGGVGIAGTVTAEEQAFRKLLQQPDAAAQCKRLLEEATSAGQMYALLGLRTLDGAAFRAAVPRYKDTKEMVATASGCIVTHLPATQIAKEIEEGHYK